MNNLETSSLDKKAAYKRAFLESLITTGRNLASKAGTSYIADAVRKSHIQHIRAALDDPMTIHGMALNSLGEHGAVGASAIKGAINRGRIALGDLDTALGAAAIGKKGLTDPTNKSLRKTLFTFKKDNYRKVNKSDGTHVLVQQSRPSISAPMHTVAGMVVPALAMMKGQELVESFRNGRKEVNPSGAGTLTQSS